MVQDDSYWVNEAQSWKAKHDTLKGLVDGIKERVQDFKTNFGVKERSNGEIEVDYDKFVSRLGAEGALELRKIIDDKYNISGKPGKKPRMKVVG